MASLARHDGDTSASASTPAESAVSVACGTSEGTESSHRTRFATGADSMLATDGGKHSTEHAWVAVVVCCRNSNGGLWLESTTSHSFEPFLELVRVQNLISRLRNYGTRNPFRGSEIVGS